MSTFLQKCEDALLDRHRNRGIEKNHTIVNTRALQELVHHYKRLDQEIRSIHAQEQIKRQASLPECPEHPQ